LLPTFPVEHPTHKQEVTSAQIVNSAEIFCNRLATRAKSIVAIPAESIPFIGVAVLIADMGADDAIHSVCDTTLPEAGNVRDGVVEQSVEWFELVREAL
jgi:hypothetical protein